MRDESALVRLVSLLYRIRLCELFCDQLPSQSTIMDINHIMWNCNATGKVWMFVINMGEASL